MTDFKKVPGSSNIDFSEWGIFENLDSEIFKVDSIRKVFEKGFDEILSKEDYIDGYLAFDGIKVKDPGTIYISLPFDNDKGMYRFYATIAELVDDFIFHLTQDSETIDDADDKERTKALAQYFRELADTLESACGDDEDTPDGGIDVESGD